MSNKNLELWDRVSETNPFFTKEVGYGTFKFTSINAQYQLKSATEQFGVYGKGWGIKSMSFEFLDFDNGAKMALAKAIFFAGESEFPISSSIMICQEVKGNMKIDDEWAKKVETDLTTKALSKLGFNADVFLGRFDDNRYVNDMRNKFQEVPKKYISEDLYNDVFQRIAKADKTTVAKIEEWANDYNDNDYKGKILELLAARKKQL